MRYLFILVYLTYTLFSFPDQFWNGEVISINRRQPTGKHWIRVIWIEPSQGQEIFNPNLIIIGRNGKPGKLWMSFKKY